jgi:hypothetical protein
MLKEVLANYDKLLEDLEGFGRGLRARGRTSSPTPTAPGRTADISYLPQPGRQCQLYA